MSTKSITVPLSTRGLLEAANWLDDYVKQLEKNIELLLNKMLREGEFTARVYLARIDTGRTISTIMGYRDGLNGVIVAGGAAVWVEFGTGVVANNVSAGSYAHPTAPSIEGIVPIGTYGDGNGANPNGWYYKGDDGQVRHTYGIPAGRFMYGTAQMLRREYERMVKEVFK